jgi:RND family efflux transporter MFP subunit
MPQEKVFWSRVSSFWWVVLIVIGAIAWSSERSRSHAANRNAADDPPTIAVQEVVAQTLVRRLRVEAELEPFQEVDVHAKVAGYVKEIYVDIGSRVHAGQLLAVLSVPELEHERDGAAADLARRQHELIRAQSEFEALHLAYLRLKEVSGSEQNLVAQQELDDAASKDRASQAAVSAAEAALAGARANDARIRSLLSYTRITAPFAGIVVRRFAHVGTMLPAGTSSSTQALPLVHLSQNDPLRLVIPVPESAAPFIHDGTPVRVHIPAIERNFDASVTRFSGGLDVATRTLRAEVDVSNPQLDLRPGEYADADITLERREGALSVPVESVVQQDGRASLFAVTPRNTVEQRSVTVGMETPYAIEITSGLSAGERVVVSNQPTLRPGDRIEPRLVAPAPAQEDR